MSLDSVAKRRQAVATGHIEATGHPDSTIVSQGSRVHPTVSGTVTFDAAPDHVRHVRSTMNPTNHAPGTPPTPPPSTRSPLAQGAASTAIPRSRNRPAERQ